MNVEFGYLEMEVLQVWRGKIREFGSSVKEERWEKMPRSLQGESL